MGPKLAQGCKARRAKDALEFLIDQARVGNGRLPLQGAEPGLLGRIVARLDLFFQELVDQRVNTADEEAGDRGNAADVLAFGVAIL